MGADKSVTITIGRGTTDGPLPDISWELFREEIRGRLAADGFEVVVDSGGTGTWVGADGIVTTEDNHVFVALAWDPEDVDLEAKMVALRAWLGVLAYGYRQEAIALGHGVSELVMATPSGSGSRA